MKIILLHSTPLWVASTAIRTCWDSHNKSDTVFEVCDAETHWENIKEVDFNTFLKERELVPANGLIGEKDAELIDRVGNKFKHASTLEHLVYTFQIKGISRAVLQELARHRMASLSVKSTRYTLKELKNEDSFKWTSVDQFYKTKQRASKYVVFADNDDIDDRIIRNLENLRILLQNGYSNDIAKYALPEAYKTELVWTINARSLQNFLILRTSKSALWEIRNLANNIYNNLPEDHKYLFTHCIEEKQ